MTHTKKTPWLFLGVPLLLYTTWVIFPAIYTMVLSFTRWDGLSPPVFTGFYNYRLLFDDPVFIKSLINNIKWLIIFLIIPITLGLSLAIMLNKEIRGGNFFKAAIYSPMILSRACCHFFSRESQNSSRFVTSPVTRSLR